MNELSETKLARPMDPSLRGNDEAALRQLVGMLNNPELTGAVVPPEEKAAMVAPRPVAPSGEYSAPGDAKGATLAVSDPVLTPDAIKAVQAIQAEATEPLPTRDNPAPPLGPRLFFTGQARSGISFLAAQIGAVEISLLAPARALLVFLFGSPIADDKTVATLRAWGAGVISAQYPVTVERATTVHFIRSLVAAKQIGGVFSLPGFGVSPTFWLDASMALAEREKEKRVILSGITTENEFSTLRSKGYSHWHVMAGPAALSKRGRNAGISSPLNDTLSDSVIRQISSAPLGKKLHAIWNDDAVIPSSRIWTGSDFVAHARA